VFVLNSLAALTCFVLICFIRKEHVVANPEVMDVFLAQHNHRKIRSRQRA
jgi:hypothetical protein